MIGPLNWVGGEHQFALRIGELRKLQESCSAGPEEVFNRLRTGAWRVDDLIEPIRLGLIGAGEMDTKTAGPFMTKLVGQHPLAEFKFVALSVMADAILGVEGDPVGEPQGVETPAPESGASAGSTETAP